MTKQQYTFAVGNWLATLPVKDRDVIIREATSLKQCNASGREIHRFLQRWGWDGSDNSTRAWVDLLVVAGEEAEKIDPNLNRKYRKADPLSRLEMSLVENGKLVERLLKEALDCSDSEREKLLLQVIPSFNRELRGTASAIAEMRAKISADDVRRALLQEIRELADKHAREMAQPQVITLVEPLLRVIEENHAERAA